MQNIDVAQETTAQLRADKKELKKNYSKQIKKNTLVLTYNVLKIDKTDIKAEKSVDQHVKFLNKFCCGIFLRVIQRFVIFFSQLLRIKTGGDIQGC